MRCAGRWKSLRRISAERCGRLDARALSDQSVQMGVPSALQRILDYPVLVSFVDGNLRYSRRRMRRLRKTRVVDEDFASPTLRRFPKPRRLEQVSRGTRPSTMRLH